MLNIDGIDVHVEGEGEHAVVMIHGWPDTYRLWDGAVAHLLAELPGQLRCVRFTLPGFDLARPPRPMSVQQLVDFVAGKVLDVLGVEHDLARRWTGELGAGRREQGRSARPGGP